MAGLIVFFCESNRLQQLFEGEKRFDSELLPDERNSFRFTFSFLAFLVDQYRGHEWSVLSIFLSIALCMRLETDR